MPSKYTGSLAEEFIDALNKEGKRFPRDVFPEIVKPMLDEVKKLYGKTLQYWNGGRDLGNNSNSSVRLNNYSSNPVVKVILDDYKFHINKNGKAELFLLFKATVVDEKDEGSPHKVWNWISYGTDAVENFPVTSAAFKARPLNRTIPNSLEVRSKAGFGEQWVRIAKGSRRAGIEARNWNSTVIPEEIEKEFSDLSKIGWLFEFEDTKLEI